jgi:ATP-dependent RNA/DNA helicase IGHMBP2
VLADLPDVTTTQDTEQPLLFLDTAGCGHDESQGSEDGSKHNEGEAQVVIRHVQALLDAGVAPGAIAVITPYNAQVQALRRSLDGIEGLEIGTVDGVQGREKEAVVISLVRSNEHGEVGFLAELRRLNVALTRARRHLCVVGDSATLSCHADLAHLVEHLQAHGEHRSAWLG